MNRDSKFKSPNNGLHLVMQTANYKNTHSTTGKGRGKDSTTKTEHSVSPHESDMISKLL